LQNDDAARICLPPDPVIEIGRLSADQA